MDRLERLHKLLAADPTDADVPYMIAQEHSSRSDNAEAIAWYDKCLAIDGDYLYAYYHKARAQQAAASLDEARATIHAGLERARAAGNEKAARELAELLELLDS